MDKLEPMVLAVVVVAVGLLTQAAKAVTAW